MSAVQVMEPKRQAVYYRLESESSIDTDEDTESVNSVQDYSTDIARDSSASETPSDLSDDDDDDQKYEIELEYDVASLSADDNNYSLLSSDSDIEAAETAIAAVLCDSSIEAWVTDGETSCDSTIESIELEFRKDFWTCVQCKSENTNPSYRYCSKCFQSCWQCKTAKSYNCFPLCQNCFKERKTLFPPRPRGTRKRKLAAERPTPKSKVKLDALQMCLSQISSSQDSGVGSSQELPPNLEFNKIVVPEHLKRKHSLSESLSESDEPPSKIAKLDVDDDDKVAETTNDLCIICNAKPKDGVFVHGKVGHVCCCYRCATKTWKTIKRCPLCNSRVQTVIKLFVH